MTRQRVDATAGGATEAEDLSDGDAPPHGRASGADDVPHLARTRAVLSDLFGPPAERRFAVRYWDGRLDRPAGEPAFTLVLAWPGALRRMLLPPTERSLGAAYVRGHCDVEGSLEAAVRTARPVLGRLWTLPRLADLARRLLALPRRRSSGSGGGELDRDAPSRAGRRHSRERDARSVRYHYDLPEDFFRLWLDDWMQYSSGWFTHGVGSLRETQESKLEMICRKLELEPDHRLLDVGCGWGGLLHFAAERYGVEATGITLSRPQARAVHRRLEEAGHADRCRVLVRDYRDLDDGERYDRAVSVGVVEHVGQRRMADYFGAVFELLEPGGLFLNQGIVTLDETPPWRRRLRERLTLPWASFKERFVFPDGELVTSAERVGPAEEAGFELRGVESFREHYATTLRH